MTHTNIRTLVLLATLAVLPSLAAAQTNIGFTNKFSWNENTGWMNWRDAGDPIGNQGVFIGTTFLEGYVWSENAGWINLGDGTPTNGLSYANPTGGPVVGTPDFGVNLNPSTGALTGFAWSENAGWINFSGGALATPAQPARLDLVALRLRGYAWSENLGWINLNVVENGKYVEIFICAADFDRDGDFDSDDIIGFFAAWENGDTSADADGDGDADSDDVIEFFAKWDQGSC